MKKVILKIILGVCVLAVVVFAVLIVRELYIDSQSRSFYDEFANVETRPREQEDSTAVSTSPGTTPDEPEEWMPYVDFDALRELYPEIVGWILLDDTPINYPIMQAADNDFFLRRLPDGSSHRVGSIFLDYRNESGFSDKSILIYGHHTRTGEMFGALTGYRNQEFYDANPVIDIFTPEGDFELILFAGHVAHSVHDHPPLEFETDEDFLDYIDLIKNKSVFTSNFEVTASDRIINLVTCTYDFNDARLIIVGVIREV
ncbi:MAG: class B sortase [Oscillospiraceae bacterium]|nr:class B sortase [Oscillospiraceae bacterium]